MSAQYREIELKHPIRNPEVVELRLRSLGARQTVDQQYQEDVYYVPAHRDFLAETIVSEWIRIRRTDGGASFNYKRWLPVGAEVQTHCDEYETGVTDVTATELILKALDMREIVRVRKHRSSWLLHDVEVSIDEVEGLGAFIELEAKTHSEDTDGILSSLRDLLKNLEADVLPQDRRGYPYQLLNRQK